ncbi:MAG TPA: sensor histidine kinase, partial [Rhodospirillaceae bacterium]|nr:sensor histidine kinase [Rhodospirillaceae bacterium]
IVRSLIELHGGFLEIESQMGEGTSVILVFPASSDLSQFGSEEADAAQ